MRFASCERQRVLHYEGRYFYVTFSMTDPYNAGEGHGPVPEDCIVNGCIDEEKLLRYVANKEYE